MLLVALGTGMVLSSAFSLVGCSRQGEGERCSQLNGDLDCDGAPTGPLTCHAASALQNSEIARCCYSDGSFEVKSCAPRRISASGGAGGEGGMSGDGGGAGDGGNTGSGGADTGSGGGTPGFGLACNYTSQCPDPLVCTLGGTCGWECLDDRDCKSGQSCDPTDNTCITN